MCSYYYIKIFLFIAAYMYQEGLINFFSFCCVITLVEIYVHTCDLAVSFQSQSIFCINLLSFAKFQTDFDFCTHFKNKMYKIRHVVKLVTM